MPPAVRAECIAAQRPYLLGVALRLLRNRERSEDAVQNTLLAALAAAQGFRGEAALRTWLTAILRNRLVDEHRARAREPLLLDLEDDLRQSLDAAQGSQPDDEAEAHQLAERMAARLMSLPPASAQAFVLRELEGAPDALVRERLVLTRPQLSIRLHRARAALRQAANRWRAHRA